MIGILSGIGSFDGEYIGDMGDVRGCGNTREGQ